MSSTPPRQRRRAAGGGGADNESPSRRRQQQRLPRRYPIPVAIELHNLFPKRRIIQHPTTTAASSSGSGGGNHHHHHKWFRPQYCVDLLNDIQLEIIIQQQSQQQQSHPDGEEENDTTTNRQQQQQKTTTIISSNSNSSSSRSLLKITNTRKTICPVWQHLDDLIRRDDLTIESYETIKARFQIVDDYSTTTTTTGNNNNGDDNGDDHYHHQHQSSSSILDDDNKDHNSHTTTAAANNNKYFLEIAIHPSKLCRIHNDENEIPDHLPLNCTVVRFSDDSIRIHPLHYQLLLDSRQIVAPVAPPNNKADGIPTIDDYHERMSKERFEDTVFHELDSPDYYDTATNGDGGGGFQLDSNGTFKVNYSSSGDNDDSDEHHDVAEDSNTARDDQKKEAQQNGVLSVSDTIKDIEACRNQDLARENQSLEQLIAQEEVALEVERTMLEDDKKVLTECCEALRQRDARNSEIDALIQTQITEIGRVQFLLEAQRIRLIRELSTIYPILIQSPPQRYLIRGLEIPADLTANTSGISDDVLAAALGYLCHLVHLMSKYLGIHLRYRLHCQSSRSAIQDERMTIYPLFQGRLVEREQFIYAVHLLDKNIECLCQARGIQISSGPPHATTKLHMLAKVKRVFESVIDGY